MSIEAMKLALEALETADEVGFWELQKTAITALRTAIAKAEKQKPVQDQLAWQNLRNRIQADINRTEGRWGMHGHSAVDDDYFTALEWVVERMDEILSSAHRQPSKGAVMIERDVTVTLTAEDIELYDRARAIHLPAIVVSMYGDRIQKLIDDERNACAAIARQWDADHPASNYGGCIANLIEARGQA